MITNDKERNKQSPNQQILAIDLYEDEREYVSHLKCDKILNSTRKTHGSITPIMNISENLLLNVNIVKRRK